MELHKFAVSYHEEDGDKFRCIFHCDAEDHDHAEEQCENAYPGCIIIMTTRLSDGEGKP